jgi:hypothetical protein
MYNMGVFPIVLSFPTPILREKERKREKEGKPPDKVST